MNKFLSLLLSAALLATSCSKKNETSQMPSNTPMHSAIDSKYIHMGTDIDQLEVEYATFNSNADCDKKVFDAALQTIV